jgi:hypothetical protein
LKTYSSLLVLLVLLLPDIIRADDDFDEHEVSEIELITNTRTHAYSVSWVTENWKNDWVSERFGMGVLGLQKAKGIYGAAEGSIRVGVPYYISPFIGLGAMIGVGWDRGSAARYNHDRAQSTEPNNNNQSRGLYGYILACYPEAGVRIWLGQHASLSGSVRYFVSSNGRSNDSCLYGGSFNVRF